MENTRREIVTNDLRNANHITQFFDGTELIDSSEYGCWSPQSLETKYV